MKFQEMRDIVNECINYPHRVNNFINLFTNFLNTHELDTGNKVLLSLNLKRGFLPTRELSSIISRLTYIIKYSKSPKSLFHTTLWFFNLLEDLLKFKSNNEEINVLLDGIKRECNIDYIQTDFLSLKELYNSIMKEEEYRSKDYTEGAVDTANHYFIRLIMGNLDNITICLLLGMLVSILNKENMEEPYIIEDLVRELHTVFRIIDFKLLIK